MKIYVLGSTHFMKEMVSSKDKLKKMGYDASIHPHYEAFVRGEMKEHMKRWEKGKEHSLKEKIII